MVDGSEVASFLNRTPNTFDWYVIWQGSKNKHHKDTCLKEIGQCHVILITSLHSIVNTIVRINVSIQEINKHALPINLSI